MKTVIVEDVSAERAISHPKYGMVRYFVINGKTWMMRSDVALAFGLSQNTSSRAAGFAQQLTVVRQWARAANSAVVCIDDAALKVFARDGVKNRERRQVVKRWLLENLYNEKEDVPVLFDEKAPLVTLSVAQMSELTQRVVDLLKTEPLRIHFTDEEKKEIVDELRTDVEIKPLTLTDAQMDDVAFKVLALMKDLQLDEDKLVERVWQKFLTRFK